MRGREGNGEKTKEREEDGGRKAANAEWGFRLIENEDWARKSAEGGSRLYKGQLVGAGGLGSPSEDDY